MKTDYNIKGRDPNLYGVIIRFLFVLILGGNVFSSDFNSKNNSGQSQLVLYLETHLKSDLNFTVIIDSMLIVNDQESEHILNKPYIFDSKTEKYNQILLSEINLNPGVYKSIRIFFSSASFEIEGEIIHKETGNFGTTVHIDQIFETNSSQAIFLYWEPRVANIEENYYIINVYNHQYKIPPPESMMFVSNEDSDNISIIDRSENRVVEVIKSGSAPRGMAYSRLYQQIYIANSGDNSISIIDLSSRFKLRDIYLDHGDEPSRLMISNDEQSLYILNYGSNSLVVYELPSFQEVDRQSVGVDPVGMAIDQFFVYISNQTDDYLNVYNPINRSVAISYETSGTISELLTDSASNSLYVSDNDQHIISVFDTQTGSISETINLCGNVTGMVHNRYSGNLYIAQDDCNEILIVQSENNFIIDQIILPGTPGLITLEPERRNIFAVMPDSNRLAVINITNPKISTLIEVGKNPYMALVTQ